MDLGFETVGNATLLCHDGRPVLVTDPWLVGDAYFGSWTLSHEIPDEQMEHARACAYAWISHGHPDHCSAESLALLRDKKILLPNHFGGRIHTDLRAQGFDVHVLTDRVWHQLSPRLRVMCIPDYNQDAVLLADLGGTLVVNLNDAGDRGWGRLVRRTIREHRRSFLLCLSGYGDADMINFKTEAGERIPPLAARKIPVGQTIVRKAELYGVDFFVPFSSMHKYQRADSLWAGQYTTPLEDYRIGFESRRVKLTPAFIRYDVAHDQLTPLQPRERHIQPRDPKEFGDDWDEPLSAADAEQLTAYFRKVRHLETWLDFIRFRVGGRDHHIALGRGHGRGITFEAPRRSLMTAVTHEVFDDLLIGNFMSTVLHGDFGETGLYPDFSPYVAKYGDNGGARTPGELEAYFRHYRARDPLGYLRHRLEVSCVRPLQDRSAKVLRDVLGAESKAYRLSKDVYWWLRRELQ
jgi:hypothetical protein